MPRSAAQSLQSILLHTPGASVAAGLQAAVGSLASATSAFLRGADRLPTAEGVRRCMEVLFADEGPPSAAWLPSPPERASGASVCGSAPGDLISRFVVLAGRMAGVRGIAVLWRAFVSEIRERWHRTEPLPHVAVRPSQPVDLGQGLLAQKLMLLGWCTARLARGEAWEAALAAEAEARIASGAEVVRQGEGLDELRSRGSDVGSGASRGDGGNSDAGSQEDCSEGTAAVAEALPDPREIKEMRAGHRRQLPGMVLLRSRLAMFEPETQPSSAFTEDTLLEHQALLMKMGSDADATAHRAGMHAAGLRSDMAAFKAANPTCCFADFVRWHSPNDWVAPRDAAAQSAPPASAAGAGGDASGCGGKGAACGAALEAGSDSAGDATPEADEASDTVGEAEDRISPRRLDGRLSSRFPGCVAAVAGVDDVCAGWAHATPVAGSPPLVAPPGTPGAAGEQGSIWMRTWAESDAAPVSRQRPVVNVEAHAEQALHYLETLTLQELLPMLFAVSASNAAHVLDHAVEGVAERSPECTWRASLARRALRECCEAASAIALAESAGEHADDAARAALMSGSPAGARGRALRGFGSPARQRKALRTLEQRGRVHDFFGAAYAAVCAVADAETALARFTALCHHLDMPQSRGAMAWRAADAELSVPGSPSSMRRPEAQATSIAAVALLCGGCVVGPLSAENSREAAIIAALADDALRQDAAYLPDALEGGHLSARVRHLVPQAQTEQAAVAYLGPDEDDDDWAGEGTVDQARAAELALDDEDGSEEAAGTSPPRAALPRLGSSLIAGRSESAIQIIAKALEGRGMPGLTAAKPSERLCVAVRLAASEAAVVSCAPVALECEARGLPHVSALEVLAPTEHPRGGPGLVYLCATQSAVRVSANQPDDLA
ncbi:hypothetical protein FNF28_03628 [Cafeteria roenbergensis]|uniref:Rab3 GTPase-activating protein catalytic subunit n=2 Tax=Cafeteria roenbergensis TaxID=33653 RepID=A0A5A8DHX7_CAFRO|nr:hypothetical protein FNF28_03628 [Cafeteria roenbergensis]